MRPLDLFGDLAAGAKEEGQLSQFSRRFHARSRSDLSQECSQVTMSMASDQKKLSVLEEDEPHFPNGIQWNSSGKRMSVASADVKPPPCSNDLVIYPTNSFYRVWSTCISFLVVLNAFFSPMNLAFYMELEELASWFDTFSDVVFFLDILLTFNVAVNTKAGVVTSRFRIARKYAVSYRLWADLLATVPLDTLYELVSGKKTRKQVGAALGLLRLLRVNRLMLLFRSMQKNTAFNLILVVVAKFVLFILLCTHTSGCIFYALANVGGLGGRNWIDGFDPSLPDRPMATRYMHALFWAVGTFKAGPASGGLSPVSNPEMLLAVLTMLVNICLQTYLVSNMAALLTTADVRIYAFRNQLRQLYEFSDRYKLDRGLQRQLQQFVVFKFAVDQELDQNVLASLPELYRQRISHALYEDVIRNVELFNGCATLFLRQLHGALKATLYMADQPLASIDEPSTQLQILAEGEVDLYERGGIMIDTMLVGEVFSAVSFLCKVGQPLAVRTRVMCRILSLDHAAWDAACGSYPENLNQVKVNLLLYNRAKMMDFEEASPGWHVYVELVSIVESHLVLQREMSIAMLCSAAARGDLPEMKRLLVGQSPNVANNDSRTPLHLAAGGGRLEVVGLLLDKQATIDAVDNFGRTPLLEACRSRQDEAASMLFESGAALGSQSVSRIVNKDGVCSSPVPGEGGEAQLASLDSSVEAGELCQAASDVEQLWYLKLLLKYRADANIGDYDARTALHVACASGNKPATELLIGQEHVTMSPQDNFGRTPLMEAVRHGHESCARLLKARGARHGFLTDLRCAKNPNAIPAGQELCQAAFSNQVTYLHNLITFCGLDVDVADYDLRTALMLACAEGNMDTAVSLVQFGADINRKDRWGHTPITEARAHGHGDLADVLLRMGKKKEKK